MRRDILDNLSVVRFIPDPHRMAALSPDASGQFTPHHMRGSLLGPPDRLSHIGRPRPDQGMHMGPHHRDDPRRPFKRKELVTQGVRDCPAQVLWDLDFLGATLARGAVEPRVLTGWWRCPVIPRRMKTMVVVAESARVAREPRTPGGPDDMHPVGPVAIHQRECNGSTLTFAKLRSGVMQKLRSGIKGRVSGVRVLFTHLPRYS